MLLCKRLFTISFDICYYKNAEIYTQLKIKESITMNKIISLILALLLMVSVAAGCSSKSNSDSDTSGSQAYADDNSEDTDSPADNRDTDYYENFTLTTLDGEEMNSEDVFGSKKLTMVNVWATYRGSCLNEMPDLVELQEELEGMDCQIIGIVSDASEDSSMVDYAQSIVDEQGLNYRNFICDMSEIEKQVDIEYVPTTFFVNEKSEVIGEPIVGASSKDNYKETIEALLDTE